MKKLSIIIPTLNEEETIGKLLSSIPSDELRNMGYDIECLVVDGGSTDNTVQVAKKHGARVIIVRRRGYGLAYLIGFRYARGDIIITGDADGTYPFEKIPVFLILMKKYNVDFITTNRFFHYEKGAWTPVNFVGNKLLTLMHFILFKLRVKDSQSGMWCFKRSLLKCMRLSAWGMEFSSEIKIEGYRCAKRFIEIPITYGKRKYGKPKLKWLRDGLRIFIFLIKKKLLIVLRSVIRRS